MQSLVYLGVTLWVCRPLPDMRYHLLPKQFHDCSFSASLSEKHRDPCTMFGYTPWVDEFQVDCSTDILLLGKRLYCGAKCLTVASVEVLQHEPHISKLQRVKLSPWGGRKQFGDAKDNNINMNCLNPSYRFPVRALHLQKPWH